MSDAAETRVLGRSDAFRALCLARLREFYREPEVVFWSFVFPIILAVGLGLAFRDKPVQHLPVAVVAGPGASRVEAALHDTPLVTVKVEEAAEAARDLRMGRVDLVVQPGDGEAVEYRYDPARTEAVLARTRVDDALQVAAGRKDPLRPKDAQVSEPGARYIDFLIPGIIGMNLMSGGMWGVGFNLVDMRIKRLLKRLVATPMHRPDFMVAQMTVRVLSMFIEVSFLLLFAHLTFSVPVRGSLVAILALGGMGALCFGGLGVLVSSRATRIESVSGLMNLVMMPMFVFSGIFFSSDRFPGFLQPFIRALPLTALNDALRAVILEGASLAAQGSRLAILTAWLLVSIVVGTRLFRWN